MITYPCMTEVSYRWDVLWSRTIEQIRADRLAIAKLAKGRRYFARLADDELAVACGAGEAVNVGRARREMRKRKAKRAAQ